jgi:hypothetical protein
MDARCLPRLVEAVNYTADRPAITKADVNNLYAADLEAVSETVGGHLPGRFNITGTYESRLLVAERPDGQNWVVANLNGTPLGERTWPAWSRAHLRIAQPRSWLSAAVLTEPGATRLLRPAILLVALYHPETFPLPRFPLAISDLARAARATCSGRVRMLDMQLGVTLEDILTAVDTQRPDIVGVSATFGQHDLMIELLDHLFARQRPPVVLAGGSLTVRNERILLDRYPQLLIARGAGEPTVADVIGHFHGDLDLADIRGIGYLGAPRGGGLGIGRASRRTATVANRVQTDIFPELDLLERTFEHHGVAQLETSRGCTNYCSFCPRGHKGFWSGSAPAELPWILEAMGQAFDRHPRQSRTLYIVDEEFIGRGEDAVERALAVAANLHDAGFRWESSCRVDQVVDPRQSRDWHVDRGRMWRKLVQQGLRRMLFGVESGVTSILERFNKETTGEQNALSIRTLSALGVPTRFTYITFDHLMTVAELRATHDFQARTDLLLRPLPDLPVEEIVDGVRDESFVRRHSLNIPLYTGISYLLVSMECLLGAAYTRQVEAAGLTTVARPAMGKLDARFADWRIGRASHHAQMWVDRNFALDYTLKSLEKILDGPAYRAVRHLRRVVKSGAFSVLSNMVTAIESQTFEPPETAVFDETLRAIMDREIINLAEAMSAALPEVTTALPPAERELLLREHGRWSGKRGWRLINEAGNC